MKMVVSLLKTDRPTFLQGFEVNRDWLMHKKRTVLEQAKAVKVRQIRRFVGHDPFAGVGSVAVDRVYGHLRASVGVCHWHLLCDADEFSIVSWAPKRMCWSKRADMTHRREVVLPLVLLKATQSRWIKIPPR